MLSSSDIRGPRRGGQSLDLEFVLTPCTTVGRLRRGYTKFDLKVYGGNGLLNLTLSMKDKASTAGERWSTKTKSGKKKPCVGLPPV